MKGIDIFCSSQSATAIHLSMEQPSSSSLSSSSSSSPPPISLLAGGSPAIDRHNPIIFDSRRSAAAPLPPLTLKKKLNPKLRPKQSDDLSNKNGRKSWSCTKPGELISPPGSTRYLLSEKVLFEPASEALECEGFDAKVNPAAGVGSAVVEQVVVLRVSLHCRGCERKMRKHISRMEGVRSFNIDFAAKTVTVSGNVTPLEVLSSISKVKNAQLLGPSIAEFKGSLVGVAS